MTNILIAEDHAILRDGLKYLLETDQSINVVGEAENGLQALEILNKDVQVDIVLTHIDMPVMDGLALTKTVRERHADIKVIILSMHNNENYVYEAFRAGASAYMMKSAAAYELKFAISHVHLGGQYICPSLAINHIYSNVEKNRPRNSLRAPDFELSSREQEVLMFLSKGLTNNEICNQLFLSKRTVEGHRQALLDKFKVRNVAELICMAMRSGLLD